MLRISCCSFVLFVLVISLVEVARGQDADDDPIRARQKRLQLMQELISQVKVYVGTEKTEIERIEKHLMRHDDASRNYKDGTLWAFGKRGRPAAMIILQPDSGTKGRWWHAATSLAPEPLRAESANRLVWAPNQPGITFAPLEGARAPAESKARRLIQMRRLAPRFTAHQFWDPDNQRFQLRLLRQPIHRYSAPDQGITDGAIFGFMINVHPELLLVLEAVKRNEDESWRYAFAKIGSAEFHGQLDDTEVYESTRAPGVLGRMSDTYRMFSSLAP